MSAPSARLAVAAVLVIAAVVWVLVNGPVEGRVLVVFTPDHGLTEADLLSVAALGVAGVLVLSGWRHKADAEAEVEVSRTEHHTSAR